MLNERQITLLKRIISGTTKLKNQEYLSTEMLNILRPNEACLLFHDLLTLTSVSGVNLQRIHDACKFLLLEFGTIWHVRFVDKSGRKNVQEEYSYPSFIDSKHNAYFKEPFLRAGRTDIARAYSDVDRVNREIRNRGAWIDCLFVTAFPTEFLAVVRRMDYFLEGSDPTQTRGFIDNPKDQEGNDAELLRPGWIRGGIMKGNRALSVAVVCASKYGPTEAALAAAQLQRGPWVLKNVLVVGVGASLDETRLALGDVAYSTSIDDITVAKNSIDSSIILDQELMFERTLRRTPDLNLVPEELKPPVLSFSGKKLILRGILDHKLMVGLQAAFSDSRDKKVIERLAQHTQKFIERTDFRSNVFSRPCSQEVIDAAASVRKRKQWHRRIQLRHPTAGSAPNVLPTVALSGSRVVKAHGMRDQLKKTFPDRLLLEMEGAGVASFCEKIGIKPAIIKSPCDLATPAKEKSWQPYCADVAAAFAIEVALELA